MAQATLNDMIREAYSAQEAFDEWDQGATRLPFGVIRRCTLDEVVAELDAANLALVRFVIENAEELEAALAAAAREGGDVQQAPAESPQSGPDRGNAQPLEDSHD